MTPKIDVRREQIRLLKLERRGLRPMARLVLDGAASKKAKLAAVVAVSAMTLAMAPTHLSVADKLGLDSADPQVSSAFVQNTCEFCDDVVSMLERNAAEPALFDRIERFFAYVDNEHVRFEQLVSNAGARLLRASDEEQDMGTGGGNKKNTLWLSRVRISAG